MGRIFGGLLLLAVLLVARTSFAEEHMAFVDASDMTGYYVDLDSIARGSYKDKDGAHDYVDARVAVVRADLNRRYLYAIRFEPVRLTYQIFASKVEAYDTKETIESQDTGGPPEKYTETSMLREVVDFIEALPRR